MTSLPAPAKKKLGLVIDLDICVGCHACAVACKEWNDGGDFGPLPDADPYGAHPSGVWFNRVHSYAVEETTARGKREMTVHFPRSCLHCETPACVTVCPTGASYKRGTMQKCTLCVDRIYNETLDPADRQPACVAACPTRARHFGDLGDAESPISKLVAERDGYALMPEFGYKPVNKYLPPRPRRDGSHMPAPLLQEETVDPGQLPPLLRWLDKVLSR